MADARVMTQAITHAAVEAEKAAVQAMAGAGPGVGAILKSEAASMGLKKGRPLLVSLTFNWRSTGKHAELRNFQEEVKKHYIVSEL